MFSAATGLMSSIGSAALNYGKQFLGSSYGQAAIGAGAGLAGDFASGLVGHYFGKKSSKYSASQQRAMAKYMMKLKKEYNEWLIPFQNESNMEYQLRYANGRPQAEVSGLRAAGLNPILAAGGGFHSGSMSGASSSSIPSSPSSGYTPSSGKGTKYYDPLLSKQLQLMDAQIDGQNIRNNNELKNMGLSGNNALIVRIANELGLTPEAVRQFFGYDFGTSDRTSPKDSGDTTVSGLLNIRPSERVKVDKFFANLRRIPLVTVEKSPSEARLSARHGGNGLDSQSFAEWINHPSNSRYRKYNPSSQKHLWQQEVKSGFWRKKSNGKYGYK